MANPFFDWLAKGVAGIAQDVRQKVVEEGFWGRVVTPRAQAISIHAPGDDKSPAEKLGWFQREDRSQKSHAPEHGRDKEAKAPDRGIDL